VPGRWRPATWRSAALTLAAALGLAACHERETTTLAPPLPSQAHDAPGTARAAGAGEGGNSPPAAVFRTRPAADAGGVIAGGSSFEVTFNLCQTTDADADDELRFTFDFDGDGQVDSLGHCRASHRYEVGAYETGCVGAVACVSDRQPEHRVCRTYQVCAIGRTRETGPGPGPQPTPSPEPTPEPSPSPDPVFTQQTIAGDFTPIASRDAWSFTALPGTEVSLSVDTVSADTAYAMQACVSTTPTWRDCIRPASRDRPPCSYSPPGGIGCPRKTTVLAGSGPRVYYLVIGGFRFTRTDGLYTVFVRSSPGVSRLVLALDNGDQPASVEE
jgi:hypothetical protein